jgi:hypothetical protein
VATSADMGWATRWWQFAWSYGLYGHYLGIGVALTVLGLCLAPWDRCVADGSRDACECRIIIARTSDY